MLCLILIVGGLLIMMGQHDRSEALFYYFRYFRLEDQVPETHLLRLIEKHISFEWVRDSIKKQSLPRHSGNERRWKPCSPNSRIKSACVACACGD